MTVLGIDVDLREDYLEEALSDDCECESVHAFGPSCSVVVTHRVFGCLIPVGANVCLAAAEYIAVSFARGQRCVYCGHGSPVCGRVVPV